MPNPCIRLTLKVLCRGYFLCTNIDKDSNFKVVATLPIEGNEDLIKEAGKQYIRERERQGKKVRGWYENERIYLYLPHIDSVYQAEKTFGMRRWPITDCVSW